MELEAFFSLFKKPFTVKYPYEPSPPPEGFRGRTEFTDECVGCGACAAVCPPKAIKITDTKDKRIMRIDHGLCIFCGTCQDVCPWEGITLTEKFEMATLHKEDVYHEMEHDLIFCEGCGNVITTRKHMEEIRKSIKDVELLDKDRENIENLCPSCKRRHFAQEIKGAMSLKEL
jgi:formate hydrogenlyase subunit 6/NADH:ubiquinone oxidoreductase subunit I